MNKAPTAVMAGTKRKASPSLDADIATSSSGRAAGSVPLMKRSNVRSKSIERPALTRTSAYTTKPTRITTATKSTTSTGPTTTTTMTKAAGKVKRPAWDTKGRLQDIEAEIGALQQENTVQKEKHEVSETKLAETHSHLTALEAAHATLKNNFAVKETENTALQTEIQQLKHQILVPFFVFFNSIRKIK